MWAQYRKTAVPIQLFIFAACAAMYWKGALPLPIVAVFFVTMQFFAILGAWWAARLLRRMARQRETLPLERPL